MLYLTLLLLLQVPPNHGAPRMDMEQRQQQLWILEAQREASRDIAREKRLAAEELRIEFDARLKELLLSGMALHEVPPGTTDYKIQKRFWKALDAVREMRKVSFR